MGRVARPSLQGVGSAHCESCVRRTSNLQVRIENSLYRGKRIGKNCIN